MRLNKPILACAVMMLVSSLSAQVTYQLAFETGQHLPSMPDGKVLQGFGSVAIGSGGQIAFDGYYDGTGGLWQWAPGLGIQSIAVNGMAIQTSVVTGTFSGVGSSPPVT